MTTQTLHQRTLQVREVNQEAREFSGIAVPWETDAEIRDWFGSYVERFAKDSVQDSDEALIFWRHSEPIGKLVRAESTDAGWEITGHISNTPRGDEAYQLLKDGVIRELSIGFEALDYEERVEDGVTVVYRTKVIVREVSLVPFGAYGSDAAVAQVRAVGTNPPPEGTPPMETLTRADLDSAIEDFERRFNASMEDNLRAMRSTEPTEHFRSLGDMVKRIASGDELAIRAYEGAISGDAAIKDGWLGNLTEIVTARQTVANAFTRGTLPATGMSVEWADLDEDTTTVDEQAEEGDDLDFGKVSLTTFSAPIATVGGWSSLTRQAIERAQLQLLDTTFEAMFDKLSRRVEIKARAALTAALAWDGTGGSPAALAEVEGDLTSQDGVVAAVLELAEHFDEAGRSLDGIWLDKASFLALYEVSADDRILQVSGAPTDKVGTIDVTTASGEVAGLKFRLLPNAAAGTIVAYDKRAIVTREAAGMPFRLQDENIVNLSKDFSIYGYIASYVERRAGLVKVVEPA